MEQLSIKLNVPPSQILLLRKDVDLPVDSSVNELGLGIADIIGNKNLSSRFSTVQVHCFDTFLMIFYLLPSPDCVVTENTQDTQQEIKGCDVITLRLQGKEKGSAQEFSLEKV